MSCAKTCACNEQMVNTKTGCVSSRAVEKQAWIMNRTKADGTLNYIDLTGALDNSYFSALINNVDPLKRIFPLPEIKNIVDVRDKSVMESAKDGTLFKVRDGIRKFDGSYFPPFSSPQMVAILQAQRCASPCKFSIDANGTIWGRLSEDGTKLYPMRMDAGSIDVIYVKPTDSEVEKVDYSFNLHPSERDCTVRGLQTSELTGDIDPLEYEGLMDVNIKLISCSAGGSSLVVELFDNYGKTTSPEPITGLLIADFTATQSTSTTPFTTTGALALTSVIEGPAGTYTFATTAPPTVSHALHLIGSKTGYDFTGFAQTWLLVGA